MSIFSLFEAFLMGSHRLTQMFQFRFFGSTFISASLGALVLLEISSFSIAQASHVALRRCRVVKSPKDVYNSQSQRLGRVAFKNMVCIKSSIKVAPSSFLELKSPFLCFNIWVN